MLEKITRHGRTVAGALNLADSRRPSGNRIAVNEAAVENAADIVLMPVSACKQLCNLCHELATRTNVQFWSDKTNVLLKSLLAQRSSFSGSRTR